MPTPNTPAQSQYEIGLETFKEVRERTRVLYPFQARECKSCAYPEHRELQVACPRCGGLLELFPSQA